MRKKTAGKQIFYHGKSPLNHHLGWYFEHFFNHLKIKVMKCWMVLSIFFYFHPYLGKMNPFWPAYFSNGLKPPTSKGLLVLVLFKHHSFCRRWWLSIVFNRVTQRLSRETVPNLLRADLVSTQWMDMWAHIEIRKVVPCIRNHGFQHLASFDNDPPKVGLYIPTRKWKVSSEWCAYLWRTWLSSFCCDQQVWMFCHKINVYFRRVGETLHLFKWNFNG